MGKSPAPNTTPAKGELKPQSGVGQADAARRMFVSSALSMSWQLAVIVLVPLIAGFKIDAHFHSSPLWTIVGFVLAIVGMVVVLKRTLDELGQKVSLHPEGDKK